MNKRKEHKKRIIKKRNEKDNPDVSDQDSESYEE